MSDEQHPNPICGVSVTPKLKGADDKGQLEYEKAIAATINQTLNANLHKRTRRQPHRPVHDRSDPEVGYADHSRRLVPYNDYGRRLHRIRISVQYRGRTGGIVIYRFLARIGWVRSLAGHILEARGASTHGRPP